MSYLNNSVANEINDSDDVFVDGTLSKSDRNDISTQPQQVA